MYNQSRFDALAPQLAPESSETGFMLLDRDLRIRAVNSAYEVASMRARDELIGEFVFDLFPDDPTDPQANGSSQLGLSMESAMRHLGTDHMPILRYDIPDPRNPEIFLPKVWTCSNSSVHEVDEQIGVRLRTCEITSLRDALTAISSSVADGNMLGISDQLHTLSALADAQELLQQSSEREIAQLHKALQTRDILGQAKGMLMERYDIDASAAFELLRKLSQDSNTRVEIVAGRLLEVDHPER
ncbi:MAG: ANTAR domain-containing protein [Mycobacterium sp.]